MNVIEIDSDFSYVLLSSFEAVDRLGQVFVR